MATAAVRTIKDRLARAAELGAELRGIAADPALHAISAEAWRGKCVALGGFRSAEELQACRAKIEATCPYLHREIVAIGMVWARNGQDRPAPWAGFADGDGPRAAAYAERIAAKLSVDQCSAVASWIAGEQRPLAAFGKLDDHSDLAKLLEPRRRELEELDAELARLFLLASAHWSDRGPVLRHGRHQVPIDAGNAQRLASALADAVLHYVAPPPPPPVEDEPAPTPAYLWA